MTFLPLNGRVECLPRCLARQVWPKLVVHLSIIIMKWRRTVAVWVSIHPIELIAGLKQLCSGLPLKPLGNLPSDTTVRILTPVMVAFCEYACFHLVAKLNKVIDKLMARPCIPRPSQHLPNLLGHLKHTNGSILSFSVIATSWKVMSVRLSPFIPLTILPELSVCADSSKILITWQWNDHQIHCIDQDGGKLPLRFRPSYAWQGSFDFLLLHLFPCPPTTFFVCKT